MDCIGDVEKQKVMAGLDALDAQEESYQKQIEQLDAIQDDMGKLKESNLAVGVEETLDEQRSQLHVLMNYSKSLKAQNEQLVERQEPLGNLVQKLNLQDKVLVRYICMNHASKSMPENALL
tara:strand:+ start:108 stop:470 length:363 start_codon:yes stop_codon:yes gene_type:complete